LVSRAALPEGGRITIRLEEVGDDVVVTVSDTGTGMHDETIKHCLEPFFSTKPCGVGMGLNICHGIVQRHHGQMGIESQPGKARRS
jgi:signal transduction histidine kinase